MLFQLNETTCSIAIHILVVRVFCRKWPWAIKVWLEVKFYIIHYLDWN